MPGQDPIPLFLTHVDTLYWREARSEHSAYYVQINNIANAINGPTLADFAARTVDLVLDADFAHLILDLRLNNGGNNLLCDGLLRELLRFQFENDGNEIFVITRHETFSAAQNCATRIERVTDAIFAGEPSSSRPNYTGEEIKVLLPYSGLIVSISNRYWQDSQPWDNRQWISMDLRTLFTFEQYAAGHDPALEAIFSFIDFRNSRMSVKCTLPERRAIAMTDLFLVSVLRARRHISMAACRGRGLDRPRWLRYY